MAHMENVSSQPQVVVKKSKPRSFSDKEDQAILAGLKICVEKGLKTNNGFKIGHLQSLLEHMQTTFPGTDIKIKPHIESKIHTWKKRHAFLVSLLAKSGVGWNDEKKQVQCSEEMWAHHAKTLKGMDSKRLCSWPYFDDWCINFGKDRANGNGGKDFANAVKKVMETENQQLKNEFDDVYIPVYDDNTPVNVYTPQEEVTRSVIPDTKKLKRTEVEKIDDQFFSMMNKFMEQSEANMSSIAAAITPDPALGSNRKMLFEALGVFPELDLNTKVVVGEKLADNHGKMEYFFSLPNDARLVLIKCIKKDVGL